MKPPIPPPCRIIREGGCSGFCDICGSSLKRSWFGLGKVIGCLQPKCWNWHGWSQLPAGHNRPIDLYGAPEKPPYEVQPSRPWPRTSLPTPKRHPPMPPVKSPAGDLRAALTKIRTAGYNWDETAQWMQKVAAHALEPGRWPDPGEQPVVQSPEECSCLDDEDAGGNRFRDWDEDCPVHGRKKSPHVHQWHTADGERYECACGAVKGDGQ